MVVTVISGSVTYVDVLRRALAFMESDKFFGDGVIWHKFVYAAKIRFPDPFKYVIFDESDPERPYSQQAEHALHVLTQSGYLSAGNPSYRYLQMDGDQRETALKRKAEAFEDLEDSLKKFSEEVRGLLVP